MPSYFYQARDSSGAAQQGTLTAASPELLSADLRARGLLVLKVKPQEEKARGVVTMNPLTWLPMTSFDVEIGFQQMASMITSGLSLLLALRTVAEQSRRPRAAAIWQDISNRIEQGSTFSDALSFHRSFSRNVIQLIRVGEHSGNLDTALLRCAEQLERLRQMWLTVVNALAYPLIVILLSVAVSLFLVLGVIPKIEKFLSGRGRSLPPLTQTLLDISNFVQTWLPQLCVGAASLLIALIACWFWPPGRRFLDAVLLKVPVISGVLRLSGTAVFARGLSVLLESGVTLLDSLMTVEHLISNRVLREKVASARQSVLRGESLASGLSGGSCFLPMLPRMVAVGESAGSLSTVLTEVARYHENQLVAVIRRLSVMIEPVVILVVGGIVGFVYLAFFTALFSTTGGIR